MRTLREGAELFQSGGGKKVANLLPSTVPSKFCCPRNLKGRALLT